MADQIVTQFVLDVKQAVSDADKLKKKFKEVDNAADQAGMASGDIGKRSSAGIKQANASLGGFGKGLKGIGGIVKSVAGPLVAAFAISKVVQDATEKVLGFQTSMSTLASITGATGEDLDFLRETAIELGRGGSRGATEIVEAFKLIGSAQPELLKNGEALAEVTKQAITLADAGVIPLEEAALALTGSLNQFGAGSESANQFIDVLANAAQAGASGIGELSAAIKVAGVSASSNNVSFVETTALLEALADKSVKGSEAGTQLRNVIGRLSSSGKGFVDGQFNINAALDQTKKELDAIQDPAAKAAEINKRFGVESASAAKILIDSNTAIDGNKSRLEELTEALGKTGAAQEQAAINNDNIQGSLKKLSNTWESLVLSIEDGNGTFADIGKFLLDFLGAALNEIIDYVGFLGDGFEELKMAFAPLINEIIAIAEELGFLEEGFAGNIEIADVLSTVFDLIKLPIQALVKVLSVTAGVLTKLAQGFRDAYKNSETFRAAINIIAAPIKELFNLLGGLKDRMTEFFESDADGNKITKSLSDTLAVSKDIKEEQEKILAQQEEAVPKQISLLESLKKKQSELKKELERQSVTGSLAGDTLKEYNDVTLRLAASQALLKYELEKATGSIAAQAAELERSILEDVKLDLTADVKVGKVDADGQTFIDFGDSEEIADTEAIDNFFGAIREQEKMAQLDQDKRLQNEAEFYDALPGLANEAFGLINEANAQRTAQRIAEIESETNAQIAGYDRQLAAGEINEEAYQLLRTNAEKKYQQEKNKLLQKQAAKEKALKIFETTIAVAQQVASVIANPILAAAIGALGATQIALIASQPLPQFEKGGLIDGKRHSAGGVHIEAEGGEYITNRGSTKKYYEDLKAINGDYYNEYLNEKYILPQINKLLLDQKKERSKDLFNGFNESVKVKASLNEINLLNSDKMNRSILKEILSAIEDSNKDKKTLR